MKTQETLPCQQTPAGVEIDIRDLSGINETVIERSVITFHDEKRK